MSEGELAGMGWIWVVAVTVRLQLQPNGPVSGKPTIRPSDGIQSDTNFKIRKRKSLLCSRLLRFIVGRMDGAVLPTY